MTLIDQLTNEFKKSLTVVFEKEANDDLNYMNQSILGCRWRAFWGIVVAVKNSKIISILALSIAVHRKEHHKENKSRVIKKLSRKTGITESNVKGANFWN